MSEPHEYLAPTWDDIYGMLLTLATRIRESGFRPDLIVGVSRGGWVPGRILSDLLENTHTANIKIEFYTGIEKTTRRPVVTQPISEAISDKRILLVDDVADTGESLLVALEHVQKQGAGDVKVVTVYHKPHSKYKPDFFAETTSRWIIFPWERLETTLLLVREAEASGKGMETVRETLKKCKISDNTITSLLHLAEGASP
jgi:hypoxanthine phosphoribosyltransferase